MMVKEDSIDILCLTETWLESDVSNTFIQIEGFNVYRKDRERKGGGTAIYVREEYASSQIMQNDGNEVDDLWVNIQVRKNRSFVVGSLYRPPKASVQSIQYIEERFREAISLRKTLYILGDFNDDQSKLKSNKMKPVLDRLGLHQLIKSATRITPDSQTVLDLLISNNPSSIVSTDVEPNSFSDHQEINCTINIKKEKKLPCKITCRTKRNYSAINFRAQLTANVEMIKPIYLTDNVTKQAQILTDYLLTSLNAVAPMETKTLKGTPVKWMTEKLRREIALKKYLKSKAKRSITWLQLFRIQNRRVKREVKRAKIKQHHEELEQCRNNHKETWNVLKRIVPYKNKITSHTYTNPLATAEKFNNFFAGIGKHVFEEVTQESDRGLHSDATEPSNPKAFCGDSDQAPNVKWKPKPVSQHEVKRAVFALKNTNSTGIDGLALQYLKDSLIITLPYISTVINTSIVNELFPEIWKHAIIKAIHKSGDKDEPSNFRPISLLPVLSKILEKVISIQLIDYLESNKLINDSQYAYRQKLSTEDALMSITEDLYKNFDDGKISLLILLDLSKAFDSVSHEILFDKLRKLGIDPTWFKNYLKNRQQSVKLDSATTSSPSSIAFGVPQGSILGPLLFLVFVNDIDCKLPKNQAKMAMYADDVQILLSQKPSDLKELKKVAETAVSNLKSWYDKNGLKLNSEKTKCILFGSNSKRKAVPVNFSIRIGKSDIFVEDKIMSLGVWFDPDLSFKHHVTTLCSKLNGTLLFLNSAKKELDFKSRLLIVHALVFSHINYCLSIWGKCTKTQMEKVQRCINFAARITCDGNHRKRDHVSPLLEKLQWLNINNRLALQESTRIHKELTGKHSPGSIRHIFSRGEKNNRFTRNNDTLHIEQRKTGTACRAFSITGPKSWNNLPTNLKNLKSNMSFRERLSKHLLANQFKTVTLSTNLS